MIIIDGRGNEVRPIHIQTLSFRLNGSPPPTPSLQADSPPAVISTLVIPPDPAFVEHRAR